MGRNRRSTADKSDKANKPKYSSKKSVPETGEQESARITKSSTETDLALSPNSQSWIKRTWSHGFLGRRSEKSPELKPKHKHSRKQQKSSVPTEETMFAFDDDTEFNSEIVKPNLPNKETITLESLLEIHRGDSFCYDTLTETNRLKYEVLSDAIILCGNKAIELQAVASCGEIQERSLAILETLTTLINAKIAWIFDPEMSIADYSLIFYHLQKICIEFMSNLQANIDTSLHPSQRNQQIKALKEENQRLLDELTPRALSVLQLENPDHVLLDAVDGVPDLIETLKQASSEVIALRTTQAAQRKMFSDKIRLKKFGPNETSTSYMLLVDSILSDYPDKVKNQLRTKLCEAMKNDLLFVAAKHQTKFTDNNLRVVAINVTLLNQVNNVFIHNDHFPEIKDRLAARSGLIIYENADGYQVNSTAITEVLQTYLNEQQLLRQPTPAMAIDIDNQTPEPLMPMSI